LHAVQLLGWGIDRSQWTAVQIPLNLSFIKDYLILKYNNI